MTFLFAHWWTLTILTLAAFLIGVSIAGLAGLKDRAPLSEPGTWGGEHPTRTPDAVCPFPNTGPSLSHGGIRPDPGSLSGVSNVGAATFWDGDEAA